MNATPDSLDSLWGQIKPHLNAKRSAAVKPKPIATTSAAEPQKLFTDPANWQAGRGVALIHADTDTLLGNFTEYLHRSVPNCRKLLADGLNLQISAIERVAGNWWLSPKRVVVKPAPWFEKRPYVLHLNLGKIEAYSSCTEVNVCLEYGAIARVELAADTQLTSTGATEGLVFLPAGTDVLGVMSLDCKVQMRKDLGL